LQKTIINGQTLGMLLVNGTVKRSCPLGQIPVTENQNQQFVQITS